MEGKSAAEGKSGVNRFPIDAACAYCSFAERAGSEAGAKGARVSAGFVQQAGVRHFPCLEPQHLHTKDAGDVTVGAAVIPCQDVTMPIKMAGSIIKVLERRADIRFI
jgi:hypothetical protein